MTIADVTQYLDTVVHPEYQEHYDNAGFLLGDPSQECRGVLVALDLTEPVVEEAVERDANLIVTHHPFLFGGVKRITPADATGRLIMRLVQREIAVYAAHTNLDNMPDGVNAVLGMQLGLTDCKILRHMEGHETENIGAGMVGSLPFALPTEAFLEQAKVALGLPMVRVGKIVNPVASRIAYCGGAGSFLIEDAIRTGADCYLTGDLKYHDFQQADGRITLVDIGHYESERFTKELFYSIISRKFSTFACYISEQGKSFVQYI